MAKGPYGGYIVVKGGDGRKNEDRRHYRNQFYGPLDKGAAKPSFCYPKRKEALEEEVRSMERAVEMGSVSGDRKLLFEADLKKKKDRLDAINESHETALKNLNEDKDAWVARHKEIKEEISSAMPTRQEVKDRHVNPHTVLKNEKSGLGELKNEYIVLSRLLGEESNVGYLQK